MLNAAVRRLIILSVSILAACTSSPSARLNNACPNCTGATVTANQFKLPYFIKLKSHSNNIVHVYLEGDGQPWTVRNKPAINPSSNNLLSLKLFNLDEASAIYLNRPCYGLDMMPENCNSSLWTDGRYSPQVIEALNNALEQLKKQASIKQFLLIGHSGGGTLAMLLAQKRDDIAGVVTIAANLDHRAWTDFFNYLPLDTSLNVATQPPLPSNVKRWHLIGLQDRQVPPPTNLPFAKKDIGAKLIIRDHYGHSCCWETEWDRLIKKIHKGLAI